jgi:lipopolysaccharide export system permease protein
MFWVFDRTVGVLALTAAMFTAAWIQRHNELTALMAAGISRVRVIVPVISAVGVVVVAAVLNRELVIPQLRDELAKRPQDLAGDAAKELKLQYDEPTGILVRGKAAFPGENRIEKPNLLLPWSQESYARQIVAREAHYKSAEGGRPAGYLLDGVTQPKELSRQPSLTIQDRRVLITPLDAPDWLQKDQCFFVTDVTPEQLISNAAVREFSSVVQLIQGLRAGGTGYAADTRVTVHARLLQPLLDMTLLLLGLPLVLGHGSRNVFVAMGLCGVTVTLFSGLTIGMRYLGANAHFISPVLAAWAPLLIFAPLAVEMAYTLKK